MRAKRERQTREDAARPLGLDLVVVGGCGHVGLPLALAFADAGCRVGIYDIDKEKIERVQSGEMPFLERGADELLPAILASGRLEMSDSPELLELSDVIAMPFTAPVSTSVMLEPMNEETVWPGSLALVV